MSADTNTLHEEWQYLNLVKNIIEKGHKKGNGHGATRSIFGHMMRFSLAGGTWPLLTTKRMAWKTCAHELCWFLRGQTDNTILQKKGVHIWDANASREFLDGRGLQHYPEGQLGPIYGFQWRHWNANFDSSMDESNTVESNPGGGGIDQLADVIRQLRDPRPDGARTSRRLLVTAWNPEQLDQMALPPCHVLMQFSVSDNQYSPEAMCGVEAPTKLHKVREAMCGPQAMCGVVAPTKWVEAPTKLHKVREAMCGVEAPTKLSCAMYQRSGDVGLGVPFNIASYSLLTHLMAHHCGLVADEFVYFLGDAHIYEDHVDALTMQSQRVPEHEFPTIRIAPREGDVRENIEDYEVEDIVFVTPYQHAPAISMNMIT